MVAAACDLPVAETLDELHAAFDANRPTILIAPPGAGKTTLVPIALAGKYATRTQRPKWLGENKIVVLEPRRLAARAAAHRMATLIGERVGGTVGYQTRDERHVGSATQIEVVTEGILTRRLQHDPELPRTAAIIFDEVHERNLSTDVGLAFALDARRNLRPDLRIMAMSATPDIGALEGVLDTPDVISSDGERFDVDIRWRPRARRDRLDQATAEVTAQALAEEAGDVLVFLPGIGEIRRTAALLRAQVGPDVDVYPLAGALPLAEQDSALAASPPGRRRVVLSTDIAETSLTVEGVRVVIDSGLTREPRIDPGTQMTRLVTVSTSRSSAEQRTGRAGRVAPGVCYRMWSKIEHGTRPKHPTPEIETADLAGFALELAAWGTPTAELPLITEPPRQNFRAARELLSALGAIDDAGAITGTGREMLRLPVHPRLARMLVAEPSSLACALASLLDERDVFRGPPHLLPAGIEPRLDALFGRGTEPVERHADRGALDRARRRARELARRLGRTLDSDDIDSSRAGSTLLWAYPDRLAIRRRPGQFQLRVGTTAWLPDDDPLAHEHFVVAADTDGKKKNARIRLGAGLNADDVAVVFADQITEHVAIEWDADRDDLVERAQRRLGSMSLGTATRPAPPGEATTAALLQRVRSTGLAVLGWSAESLSLRERVTYLHETVGPPWPNWSLDALSDTLEEWLAPYLSHATGRADLDRVDVTPLLRSSLPWPDAAELDTLAPRHLPLANGKTVPITYGSGAPTASVRVQDLFGTTQHPNAGGQPIVLELLSPADRPIQITSDLVGFWNGSWTAVRKDLAGRYPKHSWPDDPASASPRRLKPRDDHQK